MSSTTVTDAAIILSREAWRENDKRALFFTLQHGKIDAIAIGAHKIKSKLSGHLEPLRAVDVMLAEGKRGYKVAQCVTRHNFIDRGVQLPRAQALGALVRLVERATEPHHQDVHLYELLFTGLASLQAADESEIDIVFGKQLFALAKHFGYEPELRACVLCGSAKNIRRFAPQVGGVLCDSERLFEKTIPYDPDEKKMHIFVVNHLRWRSLL